MEIAAEKSLRSRSYDSIQVMKSPKYYAYVIPRTGINGVTDNWDDCKKIVSGKSGARYKGFKIKKEAEYWLTHGADYGERSRTVISQTHSGRPSRTIKKGLVSGIYFDAGTGRGQGVEISVTDENGKNLLEKILPKKYINRHGKHLIGGNVTNNYGELLACKYALMLALREHIVHVFGDSNLVIAYWSKGHIKNDIARDTIDLAFEVGKLRQKFESMGGKLAHISGDDNPADLGFHK